MYVGKLDSNAEFKPPMSNCGTYSVGIQNRQSKIFCSHSFDISII